MKHATTRMIFAYWDALRGERSAPERGEIEPGEIRHVLADTFVLEVAPERTATIRLAGTRICAFFGRELKGEAFEGLWNESDRAALRDLMAIVGTEIAGIVAGVTGTTAEAHSLDLELLLLPLRHRGTSQARQIGVLAPLSAAFWIGASPLTGMVLKAHRHIGPALDTISTTPFMAAAESRRIRHGLLVYDGGRT